VVGTFAYIEQNQNGRRKVILFKLNLMKFTSALKLKLIYVFRINDAEHRGCLKIGEATSNYESIWGLEPNSLAPNEAAIIVKYAINLQNFMAQIGSRNLPPAVCQIWAER
jgi:hypothetical protein